MKIKPNTYYKIYYPPYTQKICNAKYAIYYTGYKWVYIIAKKYYNKPLVKIKKIKWIAINYYQNYITPYKSKNDNTLKIEELSKEDVFLELL